MFRKKKEKSTTAFEKVSVDQFLKDIEQTHCCLSPGRDKVIDDYFKKIYNNIILPTRATKTSAGYDMYLPFDIELNKGEHIVIPTGIRVKMKPNQVLLALPKSGLGSKYRTSLANTVGVIDSDYYYSNNEGHIFMNLVYDGFDTKVYFDIDKIPIIGEFPFTSTKFNENTKLSLKAGSKFCQVIFVPFEICSYDNLKNGKTRNGGHGSTGI